MDPVTAFALSCNVLQLVESALKIVKTGLKLYQNAGQTLAVPEYADVQTVTTDLQRTNSHLEKYLRTDATRKRDTGDNNDKNQLISDSEDDELRALCISCNNVAQELLKKLESYHVPADKAARGAIKAMLHLWKDGDMLQSMSDRLQMYRSQLNTRIIVSLRQKVDAQSHDFQKLYARTGDIQDAIWDNRAFFQQSNETQTEVLRRHIDAQTRRFQELLEQSTALNLGRLSPSPSPSFPVGFPPGYTEGPVSPDFLPRSPSPSRSRARTPTMSIIEAVRSHKNIELRNIIRRNPSAVFDFEEETGLTALHVACQNNNFEAATRLLKDGARVNPDDNDGNLPLHFAAKANHGILVRLLMERGGDARYKNNQNHQALKYAVEGSETAWILSNGPKIDAKNGDGETALHFYSGIGDIETVTSLLEQGAEINSTNSFGRRPISDAASGGHLEVMKILLKAHANILLSDLEGRTPLHAAVLANQPEAVHLLISHGAQVGTTDHRDHIPLNDAADGGYLEIAKDLLAAGSEVEHMDTWGYHPLGLATREGHAEVVRLLLEHGADIEAESSGGWTAIHEATAFDQAECVKVLLEYSPNLDFRIEDDYSPLHIGIYKGATDAVAAFLDCVADPVREMRRTCADGMVALHIAAKYEKAEIIPVLFKHGADPAPMTKEKRATPIILAAETGHFETVNAYLANVKNPKLRVNASNTDGLTALHYAAAEGHEQVVVVLLASGADPHALSTDYRYIPLHLAAMYGHTAVATLLLDSAPDQQAELDWGALSGHTALHEAACHEWPGLVAELIERGADVNRVADGVSPLSLACRNGSSGAARVLLNAGADVQLVDGDGKWLSMLARDAGADDIVALLRGKRAESGVVEDGKY